MLPVARFFASYHLSAIEARRAQAEGIPYEKASKIGILATVDTPSKEVLVDDFYNYFINDQKEVQVLAYQKSSNYKVSNSRFNVFTPQDITIWGHFKNTVISNFTETSFDYLFHVDGKADSIMAKILLLSQAKTRFGTNQFDFPNLYDIMIKFEEEGANAHLCEDMYQYAKILFKQ